MNLKKATAKKAYLKLSKNLKKDYLLAFEYLLVDQKRFLDSELSLETISSELNVSKGHLSRLINSGLGMNFNDYVNTLRVNEAKIQLNQITIYKDKIWSIGLKSGFNSKSTFYASFKKMTGLTPYQFKNNTPNKSEMMT